MTGTITAAKSERELEREKQLISVFGSIKIEVEDTERELPPLAEKLGSSMPAALKDRPH